MEIIKNSKIYFFISGASVLISIMSIFLFGLNLGIDFTGGSLMEVKFIGTEAIVSAPAIRGKLADLKLKSLNIQPSDNNTYILRFAEISEDTHQKMLEKLRDPLPKSGESAEQSSELTVEELRFDSIGPTVGKELQRKSLVGIVIVIVGIIIYIAWAFRKVSKPIPSWQYGVIAVITLVHDVLITTGVFSLLGHFKSVELDISFVAAMLTVFGYSVNDTIVVFDRVRENIIRSGEHSFADTVNKSVNQTITRSLNTSLTTLFALVSVFVFGGETVRYFILALIIGISIGTYSSIFIASPLLVTFFKIKK